MLLPDGVVLLPAPLGLVLVDPEPVALPDGVVVVAEPEPLVELPGVVVVPGDADGVVRSGVLPTRSVSVRLQATLTPASNARAQRPDSILFISELLLVGCSTLLEGATPMPAARRLT